ncbi:RtcB family protein [Halocatena marina]|uniref:tRNA-splicing ligase RtcB n=1 Tax=Halocatena marina TaxID=2934937 RepID=A0ABD5YW49_9EURY|nr:RtcB family protein [Halocatena marina]
MIEINGKHTDAVVQTPDGHDDLLDDMAVEQIQKMVSHEAFQEPVAIMPDSHAGSGAVIGFTMPLGNRVCPNTIGVDIGCGVDAVNLGPLPEFDLREADKKIREAVPFGFEVHDKPIAGFRNMPLEPMDDMLRHFSNEIDEHISHLGYGNFYIDDLLERVGYDKERAEQSIGTLGGGNHFIEISKSENTDDYWIVVHSGSRGLGLNIAQYWQNKATEERNGEMETIDYEAIREGFEGKEIEREIERRKAILPDPEHVRDTDLDYLEGEEAHGYYIDMLFAQQYALLNRDKIIREITDALEARKKGRHIRSIHNYIDFSDGIMRKGAIKAQTGHHSVIPLNMRDGTLIVEGKGNEDWNYSAPHGAGRMMSRTRAFNELSVGQFSREMGGIFSTSVGQSTLDESPMAYKPASVIEMAIEPTAEVIDRLTPVLNCKADQ